MSNAFVSNREARVTSNSTGVESSHDFVLQWCRSSEPDSVAEVQDTILQRKATFAVGSQLQFRNPGRGVRICCLAGSDIIKPSWLAFRNDCYSIGRSVLAAGESVSGSVLDPFAITNFILQAQQLGKSVLIMNSS